MKKLLALLFVLVLAFSLCACGDTEQTTTTNPQTTTTTQATTDGNSGFVKPANYASVMLVTINPQFRLYLDADGKVLAIEAVNDDAKSIESKLDVTGKGFETAVEDIITQANAGGFIEDGGAVTLEITEAQNVDVADILNKASAAANKTATDLKIQFAVNAQDKTGTSDSDTTTTTTEPTTTTTTVAPATTTTKPTTATPTPSVLNPKTDLKEGVEYIGRFREDGSDLRAVALQIDGEYCVLVDRFFTSVKPEDEGAPPIVFNGKTYYSEGGGLAPYYYELTDTEVIVTTCVWEDDGIPVALRLTLQFDGTLKVTESHHNDFPVGTVLSTNMSDVLR